MDYIVDIIIAVFLLISLIGGLMRGIIKSISWLPGLVLGALAVKFFTTSLASIIAENTTLTPLWSTYVSVVVLMAGTYLVIRLLANIFHSILEEIGLGAIDRILGGLFSLAFTLVIIGLFVTFVDGVPALSSLKTKLDSSILVVNVIRPFFSLTLNFVKEVV